MPNSCGLVVGTVGKSLAWLGCLFTWPASTGHGAVPKARRLSAAFTYAVLAPIHHYCKAFIAVSVEVFPTIHTPNKDHKDFLLNPYYLLIGG